ncbi:MAG TPA: murein biosynthesis integral membrane protein MurJ, partial [Ktedonobacterales bacterium]|nr:murein biosynthesis integral membrane protein MurJ [Ktedonobacterales bacterium]
MERSFPSTSLEDLTGTGKISSVVPMRPSRSDRGWRAPSTNGAAAQAYDPRELEVDDQPSIAVRAFRSGNMARAALIVTSATLLSRALGLGRTTLFAATFGNTDNADAFTNAFLLPDTIFSIVAGGALASAFIPVFAEYMIDKRDKKTAWHLASSALNLTLLVLVVVAGLGIIFADPLVHLTMPAFFGTGDQRGPIIVHLTRIMLLQPIFLGGATVAIAILQARQSFVLPALGQVVYTASLIAGILASQADARWHIFGGNLGLNGPALGVVAGAVFQLLIQLPGLVQAKMKYRFSFDLFHPGIKEMIALMVPRLLNAVILYVSVGVNRYLLSILNDTGATYGYVTAFSLILLPTGIFGMAVSQAAFPTLAAYVAAGQLDRLTSAVTRTIRGITYLAVPSSFGMMVLAEPITRVVIGHGQEVDLSKLYLTYVPLIFFGIGLAGLSLVEILTRSFYALHNTRTPVQLSILQFMFGIGLSLMLLVPMGSGG